MSCGGPGKYSCCCLSSSSLMSSSLLQKALHGWHDGVGILWPSSLVTECPTFFFLLQTRFSAFCLLSPDWNDLPRLVRLSLGKLNHGSKDLGVQTAGVLLPISHSLPQEPGAKCPLDISPTLLDVFLAGLPTLLFKACTFLP